MFVFNDPQRLAALKPTRPAMARSAFELWAAQWHEEHNVGMGPLMSRRCRCTASKCDGWIMLSPEEARQADASVRTAARIRLAAWHTARAIR